MLNKKIALSWSGGKDGCMALHRLVEQGYEVACLLTTVPVEIGRTFGHGEKTEMIKLQGNSLNIPVHFIACSFDHYTEDFIKTLIQLKDHYDLSGIAFGDLYFDPHREWGEKVAEAADVNAIYPLWMKQEEASQALEEFVRTGYEAVVIRVREDILDESWLGRKINSSFVKDILVTKSCPMGEAGEYHSFVYDGPLFSKRIQLEKGKIITLETTKKLEFEYFCLTDHD
ncbi:diphthine--ammonia ligase [Paenibacillus sp. BSR1-1]|uniref:Dph6-related ATP pyrophosphatase n=1 Tax=Paenibacillus sp. BSR1-1 TaxID=3020845 RepID=UPI00339D4A5F